MGLEDLPALNATLNSVATALLVAGLISIKTGRTRAHIACMVSALVVSAAFLTSYLIYHYNYPTTKFAHGGAAKAVYFVILFTHIPLAAINLPMIIMTVVPALRRRFDKHKRIARWTYPVWLYVSVTGVLVYLMLYVWFPAPPPGPNTPGTGTSSPSSRLRHQQPPPAPAAASGISSRLRLQQPPRSSQGSTRPTRRLR